MPTFASITRGATQVRTREVELLGETKAEVAFRCLSSGEDDEAIAFGRDYAKGLGYPDDPDLREAGRVYKRVALAFLDPEAWAKRKQQVPFFTGPEQIRTDPQLGRERAVYLNEIQELFQDECCPSRLRMGDAEFHIALRKIAGADSPDPFVDLRPGLRWSFARTTAIMLLDFLRLSASSGITLAGTTNATTTPASEAPNGLSSVEPDHTVLAAPEAGSERHDGG